MVMNALSYSEIVRKYPPVPQEGLRGAILSLLRRNRVKIVVLDDDPTGIQTVQGNYLLTNWAPENVAAALGDEVPFFYLLTNTRAVTAAVAETIVRDAVLAVLAANRGLGYRLVFVSRSDSTLRGHFPLEPEIVRETVAKQGIPMEWPIVFTPAFFEAGRYTVGGIHYMKDGDSLVPVSETEFARDNVFGYTQSGLADYIREKSGGCISREQVGHIGLEELRCCSSDDLAEKINGFRDKSYIALDAFDYGDLRKFAVAWLGLFVKSDGYALLRTSSSMPKALSGIADRPLLDGSALASGRTGGLFIVGSHVRKTTTQLGRLLAAPGVQGVEVDIHEVLCAPGELLGRVEEELLAIHEKGGVPVVYTSRQELRLDDVAERQRVGQRISAFLVDVVRGLRFQPAYLVAKGGITSHDILTEGLGIERVRVWGQVLPGVPAVITDLENRFPEMPYIIFPGNVGSEDALKDVFERLKNV